MGKRKTSSRGPVKKAKQRLDTTFTCLFCNHESSISCTIDKKTNIGTLNCKICGQSFQSPINSLSEPIDIYSNWIDACEAVAEEEDDVKNEDEYEDDGEEEEVGEEQMQTRVRPKVEEEEDDEYEVFN